MSDRHSPPPPRVTLEDLLSLKKAEQPPPQFWTEFERKLREKQLAALVERKTWWGEPIFRHKAKWLGVPLGATAALTLTFISLHYYAHQDSRPQPQMAAKGKTVSTVIPLVAVRPHHSVASAPALGQSAQKAPLIELASDNSVKAQPAVASAPLPQRAEPAAVSARLLTPWLDKVVESRPRLMPTMGAVVIPPVTIKQAELMSVVAPSNGFEERAMSPSRTAEMLPTASALTDPRRTRLAALVGDGAYHSEPVVPEHAKRSVTRYLAQDEWDRSAGRLEAEGDRLSIRF